MSNQPNSLPATPISSSVEHEGWKARPIKLKIFGSLIAEVISKDLCMYCGACIASCPIDILFHSEKEEPIMRGTCAACQVCYYSCPRIELPVAEIEEHLFGRSRRPEEALLGVHTGLFSVRSKDPEILKRAQDGGAGTSLLLYALEHNIIDYALVSGLGSFDPWRPEPNLARTRQELLDCAGSRYTPGGQVGGTAEIALPNRARDYLDDYRIAFVGLPCEIQGLSRMNSQWLAGPKLAKNLVFTIGLFCSVVFNYDQLMVEYIRDKRQINLKQVTKVNVKRGRLQVNIGERVVLDEPVESIAHAAREECAVCVDYPAELADIAIGAKGSAKGWTTVITRSSRGEAILKGAEEAGYVDVKKLDPDGAGIAYLKKLCGKKRLRDPSHYLRHRTSFPRPEPKLIPLETLPR
ncbi:MAG TPA: Coenzyme F420 hydrogenase/dehydrogenase, beta subunit C-terminal domain [Candidatus Bathyarchaeia archaeon]|nr:Coenzyme F420 hydrogenase/dehydrogenase, beta subunit C-terminal domain [Candidatus Bathyarchaeia archaeon]